MEGCLPLRDHETLVPHQSCPNRYCTPFRLLELWANLGRYIVLWVKGVAYNLFPANIWIFFLGMSLIRDQLRYRDFDGFFLARLTLTFQFRSKPYIENLLWQHLLVGDEGLRGSYFTPSSSSSIPNLYCNKKFF